jgi:hypothetical protein
MPVWWDEGMTTESALSITLDGTPDLPGEILKALYRITGRSTLELRRSILASEPVYTATLFSNDHVHVVPRLEKVVGYVESLGLTFTVQEWVNGAPELIELETMRAILQASDGGTA